MSKKTDAFEETIYPSKHSALGNSEKSYRVYINDDDFVSVEATTALEAFRKSGVVKPIKIVRESAVVKNIVDQNTLTKLSEDDSMVASREEIMVMEKLGIDVSGLIETEQNDAPPEI